MVPVGDGVNTPFVSPRRKMRLPSLGTPFTQERTSTLVRRVKRDQSLNHPIFDHFHSKLDQEITKANPEKTEIFHVLDKKRTIQRRGSTIMRERTKLIKVQDKILTNLDDNIMESLIKTVVQKRVKQGLHDKFARQNSRLS